MLLRQKTNADHRRLSFVKNVYSPVAIGRPYARHSVTPRHVGNLRKTGIQKNIALLCATMPGAANHDHFLVFWNFFQAVGEIFQKDQGRTGDMELDPLALLTHIQDKCPLVTHLCSLIHADLNGKRNNGSTGLSLLKNSHPNYLPRLK